MKNEIYTPKIGKIIGEMIGLIIGYAILTFYLPHVSFITANYQIWYPIAITSAFVNAISKSISHLVSSRYTYFFEIIALIASLISTYKFLQLSPFDFAQISKPYLNNIFQFAFSFVVFALLISILANFFKFTAWTPQSTKSTPKT